MRRIVIFALFLILPGSFGCAHPELTRRYISKNYNVAPLEYVHVSAFVMNTPPPAPHSSSQDSVLAQLNPVAQYALISKLAESAKSPEELTKALAASGKSAGDGSDVIERNVFKKRVVFSVEKKSPGKEAGALTPADRINVLKVTLDLKDDDNHPWLVDWDKFDTKYQTIDLGTLTRTDHGSADASISAGPATGAKVPISGTANIAREKTIAEVINLRQRVIQMTGAIKEKKRAVLYQESEVGFDLAGNFSVDFTITTKPGHTGVILLGSLKEDTTEKAPQKIETKKKGSKENVSKPSEAGNIDIAIGHLRYPVSTKQPVVSYLTTEYTIRHVRQLPLVDRYDREIAEGLQRVVFLKGESPKNGKPIEVELISQADLNVRIYDITKDKRVLYFGRPDIYEPNNKEIAEGNPLRFLHFKDANRFLEYLKKHNLTEVGGRKIYDHHENPISKDDISALIIKQKRCTDISPTK
jgi:hypothetical protein